MPDLESLKKADAVYSALAFHRLGRPPDVAEQLHPESQTGPLS